MKKTLSVFDTRPEAIKMAPVIKELEKYPDQFRSVICVTGQHRQMLDHVLELFDFKPDYDLDLMRPSQNLFDISCSVLQGLKPVLEREKPSSVIVKETSRLLDDTKIYEKARLAHNPYGNGKAVGPILVGISELLDKTGQEV